MALTVIASRPLSLRPPSPPLRFRPPPDLPPCLPFPMPFEPFSPPVCSSLLALFRVLSPSEPPDPPPCSSFSVLFEALSPPEPPDIPDVSFSLVFQLHFDTPFTLSQAFFKTWNLDTPLPNLASGNVFLANILSEIVGVILPFIPFLNLLSKMATNNGGGGDGGVPLSSSVAYELYSPVVYRSVFGCVYDTFSFAYGLYFPVIYRSHLSSLVLTYSAIVEWFRQLCVWGDVGIEVHDFRL
ncbi:Uncharacterized protein Rs2_05346 [Raphanus sativus]|nr:Uncharacterized protein Rs2_05346 [Raphanus sativus]